MGKLAVYLARNTVVSRFVLNAWPCIRGTGGHITHIAADWTQLSVRLPLSFRTRNAVGTIFGGSMYASTDPFFMLMLMRILGEHFVVWDKACTIRFKRPAKQTLYAEFQITPEQLRDVREQLAQKHETDVCWTVQYRDKSGAVYAEFDKVLYVAEKAFYDEKLKARAALPADHGRSQRSVA